MTAETDRLSETLMRAALSEPERRIVERIVDALRADLGKDLLAVWLYGSRARGEADPNETHYDRRSDIDMMAIVDPRRDAGAVSWDFTPKLIELVEAEGDSPPYYSLRVYDAARLRNRRQIRSFFFQEVDRDKLVLSGDALEGDAGKRRVQVSPRSEEFMDQARDRLAMAREVLASGHLEGAVSAAYYAMLYAARAALSERDEYARRHGGTWGLFHRSFVATGAFDQHLHSLAQQAQEAREGADYEAIAPDPAKANGYVEGAAEFVEAVEHMLAAD